MVKRTDVKVLFDKSCESKITPEEIAEVMERLQTYLDKEDSFPGYDLWLLLQTLRFVGIRTGVEKEYSTLVEKFLSYTNSAFIAADALSILCIDWHLSKEYSAQIKSFMRGVVYSDNNLCRLTTTIFA